MKDFWHEALFGRNALRRTVIAAQREANEPLKRRQITERIIATKGKALKPGMMAKEGIRGFASGASTYRWIGGLSGGPAWRRA